MRFQYCFLLTTAAACTGATTLALTAEWIQLHPTQTVTPRRSGHAAFVHVKNEDDTTTRTPYVFGGYVEVDAAADSNSNESSSQQQQQQQQQQPQYQRYVVNDLWKWSNDDPNKQGWTKVDDCRGDLPGPRLATAMAVCQQNNKAYLLGGWDPQTAGTGGVILDTVHELDLLSERMPTWRQLAVTIPDGPTSRHVAVALHNNNNNQILLHNHRCVDCVWLLDPATETFAKQPTTGPCPSPRGLHGACLLLSNNSNKLLVFGGAAQDQTMSNEAFVLDTDTWEWSRIEAAAAAGSNDGPTPRASPCVVAVSETVVVVFGGAEYSETMGGLKPRADVWALDVEKKKWTCLLKDDAPGSPPPRNAATLTEIASDDDDDDDDDDGCRSFLLTGGWAPFRETWDDCYVLKVRQ